MTLRLLVAACLAVGLVLPTARAAPAPETTAAAVDAALARGSAPGPRADDATFLRRVTLDLTGKLPDPPAIDKFVTNPDADKRAKVVDELLGTEAYAVNWGRYWRDTVTYHTPASANYLRWKLFDDWWTDQLRRNRPWNEVVTALVTASGVNDELAPVNYLTALYGNPAEVAATTSRVFLGVQIQCAECHDAKGGLPWKRQQFHELAAFFGRARLIQHKDVDGRGTPYAIESRADGQYRMTEKKDPTRLVEMAPRFFTGEGLPLDADDAGRRQLLAKVLTDPKNPWFAKCYVNRMWTALLGWGFYPSVTDLGPTAEPVRHKEALAVLTAGWIDSGYDAKWLFRTIARTEAYQRRTPGSHADEPPPAVCPVRLRPEQVFEALQKALGFDENDKTIPAPAPGSGPAVPRHTGLRHMVYQAFKADPSAPAAEVEGTIPQALLMMNSAMVHAYTSATGKTLLAELLAKKQTDEQILTALYERVLARKPTAEDLSTCQRYIAKVGNRREAFEDVLWALVNSTEFLLKK
jgi:Protein of unknown function (DUF1549)/Protein of unknown function (DUF1553)